MARTRPAEGELGSMTRSVAERVIYEANLGAEDTKIARMYYIERLAQIEIAAEIQVDRKTISERLRYAWSKVGAVVYAWAGIKKRRSLTSVFLSAAVHVYHNERALSCILRL